MELTEKQVIARIRAHGRGFVFTSRNTKQGIGVKKILMVNIGIFPCKNYRK